jgi:Flp pilus assembly protein TadD
VKPVQEKEVPMYATATRRKIKPFVLPAGLVGIAAVAMAAAAGLSAPADARPSPDRTAAQAQTALATGKIAQAITLAEAVVAAAPREPAYRALLGNAYLEDGRFESAAQALNDAMALGDNSARTALTLALAEIGAGHQSDALAILDDWREAIPAADLGLALALAGETGRGVAILSDALRTGDNSPKVRQNLAYAYALDGRWREARVMAAQDIPANLIDDRIGEWAALSRPQDSRARVAALLSVPVRGDAGQPGTLALAENPQAEQAASEMAALASPVPTAPARSELLPVGGLPAQLAAAPEQYQPVAATPPEAVSTPKTIAARFVANAVVQPVRATLPPPAIRTRVAVTPAKAKPLPQRAVTRSGGTGTHMVQLGSFLSEQGARRAWGIYVARTPQLKNYRMVITSAQVRGKQYWRVAAADLGASAANGLCSGVKARGGACFAYAGHAAAIVNGVRVKAQPALAAAKPVRKTLARGSAGPVSARRH